MHSNVCYITHCARNIVTHITSVNMYDKIPLDALLLTLTSSDDQTESLSSMTASVMDAFQVLACIKVHCSPSPFAIHHVS